MLLLLLHKAACLLVISASRLTHVRWRLSLEHFWSPWVPFNRWASHFDGEIGIGPFWTPLVAQLDQLWAHMRAMCTCATERLLMEADAGRTVLAPDAICRASPLHLTGELVLLRQKRNLLHWGLCACAVETSAEDCAPSARISALRMYRC